jgi:ATP-binding cassette, subfamily B, multidrug efflux pump
MQGVSRNCAFTAFKGGTGVMSKNEYKIGENGNIPQNGSGGPRGFGGPGGPGGMRATGENAKDFKQTWKKLIDYCKPYLAVIITALFCSVVGTIFTLVGPNKLSEITDLITKGLKTGIDLNAVVKIGVTLVVLYGMGALLSFAQGYIMATVTQKVTKSLRSDISHKINRLPFWYYNKTTHGDVLSRVTNDVDTIGQTMNQSIGTLISAATLFLGSLIMMLFTNVIMTIAAVVSTLIGFALMMIIMSKSQKYFTSQQRYLGAMNGHVEEIYSGHNVVKAYNGEKSSKKDFDDINEKLCDSAFKSQLLSGLMMPIMSFIGNFGYVAVCISGAILAINGSITFGVIVAFMLYIRLFTQPLSQLAQAATSLQFTAAASERVFGFLDEEEMPDESHKTTHLSSARGEVEFHNVSFGYEDSDETVIHNFSAKANSGQKIAIVGPTGAGKTTIVNLLMRFHEIKDGEILIDGVPISKLTRENVHDLFCMVLQNTWLFEGTIRENIVYCKEDVNDAEVVRVCKSVGIHHFIKTLPHGYDTILSNESSLSAGQKQQITIARAMIENAPMLILDEATSSVDTRTEVLIQRAMDKLMEGRTSFVIAHRLSTIKNADIILVMKDGDIIESGNHQELLAKGGFYAELYNSQFEKAS